MEVKSKNSIIGKEKKTLSSNSHIGTKKITKPLPQKTSSSTNNVTLTPLEKNNKISKIVKPTIRSSQLESPSSLKNPRSDVPPIRRRSFDRPQSSSSSKQTQIPSPTTSRLHKALVSPDPRGRKLSIRSSIVPVKNSIPAKTISNKLGSSKNPNDGKAKQVYVARSTKNGTSPNRVSTSTNIKKENNDHASPKNVSNIENDEVEENTNQEVEEIKVVNDENKVDHISEVSSNVLNCDSDSKRDNVDSEHEYDQGLEESDKLHNQDDDDESDEKEENKNYEDNNDNNNNINTSQKEEHFESNEVTVNEKEDEDEGEVLINNNIHRSDKNNEEDKEDIEGGRSEKIVFEKIKVETTPIPQNQHGKKESQLSNDVIEETTNKLIDQERKNKVRAMAGAFQTVIDYQTISK